MPSLKLAPNTQFLFCVYLIARAEKGRSATILTAFNAHLTMDEDSNPASLRVGEISTPHASSLNFSRVNGFYCPDKGRMNNLLLGRVLNTWKREITPSGEIRIAGTIPLSTCAYDLAPRILSAFEKAALTDDGIYPIGPEILEGLPKDKLFAMVYDRRC